MNYYISKYGQLLTTYEKGWKKQTDFIPIIYTKYVFVGLKSVKSRKLPTF